MTAWRVEFTNDISYFFTGSSNILLQPRLSVGELLAAPEVVWWRNTEPEICLLLLSLTAEEYLRVSFHFYSETRSRHLIAIIDVPEPLWPILDSNARQIYEASLALVEGQPSQLDGARWQAYDQRYYLSYSNPIAFYHSKEYDRRSPWRSLSCRPD